MTCNTLYIAVWLQFTGIIFWWKISDPTQLDSSVHRLFALFLGCACSQHSKQNSAESNSKNRRDFSLLSKQFRDPSSGKIFDMVWVLVAIVSIAAMYWREDFLSQESMIPPISAQGHYLIHRDLKKYCCKDCKVENYGNGTAFKQYIADTFRGDNLPPTVWNWDESTGGGMEHSFDHWQLDFRYEYGITPYRLLSLLPADPKSTGSLNAIDRIRKHKKMTCNEVSKLLPDDFQASQTHFPNHANWFHDHTNKVIKDFLFYGNRFVGWVRPYLPFTDPGTGETPVATEYNIDWDPISPGFMDIFWHICAAGFSIVRLRHGWEQEKEKKQRSQNKNKVDDFNLCRWFWITQTKRFFHGYFFCHTGITIVDLFLQFLGCSFQDSAVAVKVVYMLIRGTFVPIAIVQIDRYGKFGHINAP